MSINKAHCSLKLSSNKIRLYILGATFFSKQIALFTKTKCYLFLGNFILKGNNIKFAKIARVAGIASEVLCFVRLCVARSEGAITGRLAPPVEAGPAANPHAFNQSLAEARIYRGLGQSIGESSSRSSHSLRLGSHEGLGRRLRPTNREKARSRLPQPDRSRGRTRPCINVVPYRPWCHLLECAGTTYFYR